MVKGVGKEVGKGETFKVMGKKREGEERREVEGEETC